MDIEILKTKKIAELREIAKTFHIENYEKMKKNELVEAISEPRKTTAPAAPTESKKAPKPAKTAEKPAEIQEKPA